VGYLNFENEFKIAVGEMGMRPEEFWKLTPYEFQTMIEGHTNKQKNKYNDLKGLAWYIAVLSRAKEIPELEKLLGESTPKKEQTPEEMVAIARILNAAYGGEETE
jgi:hypothetical protein